MRIKCKFFVQKANDHSRCKIKEYAIEKNGTFNVNVGTITNNVHPIQSAQFKEKNGKALKLSPIIKKPLVQFL